MRLKESELKESIQETVDKLNSPMEKNGSDENGFQEESCGKENMSIEEKKKEEDIIDLMDEELEDSPVQVENSLPPIAETKSQEDEPLREESSHTRTLNDLMKEVQIFADDEDFLVPKKRWKKVLGWILFFLIFATCIFLAIYFWPKNEKETKKESNTNHQSELDLGYSYQEEDGEIHFLKGTEEIDSYLCVNENCSIYSLGRYQYHQNGAIAIQDGESVFLYDYMNKKEISENYVQLKNLVEDGTTKGFIAKTSEGKVGVIDNTGNVIIAPIYDDLGYSIGGGDVTDYSYEKDVITASKDNSWGLIKLSTGEEVIPFLYDDIYYTGSDILCLKREGLWYAADLQGNILLEDGYDMIMPVSNYIFVSKEGTFMILNRQGERVIQQDIPTYILGFRGRVTSEIPTFKVEEDGTIITIYIMQSPTDDTLYQTYKFNTVNGELSAVIR